MSLYYFDISHRIHLHASHLPSVMLNYYLRKAQFASRVPGDAYSDLRQVEQAHLPNWSQNDPYAFYLAAYQHERVNGRYATVLVISLPRELSRDQQVDLVRDFTAAHLRDKPYIWALHEPLASDGGYQPHIHLVMSQRSIDGIDRKEEQFFKRYNAQHPEHGGACKDPFWRDRRSVEKLRESWAILTNLHLERAGRKERVDHRSLYRQGIYREPAGPFGKHGDPRDIEVENIIATNNWEKYKEQFPVMDFTQEQLITHVRDRARNTVPGRAWTPRTLQEREERIKQLSTAEQRLRQYTMQLEGVRKQDEYWVKSGKEPTRQMRERQEHLLNQEFIVPHANFERVFGRVEKVRIFEDERVRTHERNYQR